VDNMTNERALVALAELRARGSILKWGRAGSHGIGAMLRNIWHIYTEKWDKWAVLHSEWWLFVIGMQGERRRKGG
jgi:hypothetical protein